MPANLAQKSDDELLLIYRNRGEKLAIGELYKRHALMCFTVCNKYYKNEDASQDAVMQIFEHLFNLLQKHEVSNFRSWLHSVARNYCLMDLRKPQLLLSLSEDEEENESGFMEKLIPLHLENEEGDKEAKLVALESAILGLNQKQQDCLRLFYLEQMSYEQVSAQTELSLMEVKSAIQNGKRNLKNSLTEKGITYLLAWAIWIQQSA
ncbi:MAG: sigma-70 family RNA polymerase sigma factor [Bacteroidia bacterium]|jgi:RNA polymerase sigma factor (sigma-70 family)|nr:sigma-70 family RNA polymerase sigma factor [Bacteroidia bacterium]